MGESQKTTIGAKGKKGGATTPLEVKDSNRPPLIPEAGGVSERKRDNIPKPPTGRSRQCASARSDVDVALTLLLFSSLCLGMGTRLVAIRHRSKPGAVGTDDGRALFL